MLHSGCNQKIPGLCQNFRKVKISFIFCWDCLVSRIVGLLLCVVFPENEGNRKAGWKM